jgi:hypothetical protein
VFVLAAIAIASAAAADRTDDAAVSRIRHEPVESRALVAIGYSKRLRALEVEFRRGGTYRYLGVPPSVYQDLLASDSKAGFYNSSIRGKYRAVFVRSAKRSF